MQQINLYQPELKPQRAIFPAIRMLQVLGLFVLVLVALSAYTWWQVQPLHARKAQAQQNLAAATTQVEQMRAQYPPPQRDESLVVNLAARRAALEQTREIVVRLESGAFGSVTGLSPYLTGFARQHVDGTWLTGVRVLRGGAALALEGRALRPELVPAYLERLSEESVFSGKSFSELQLSTGEDTLNEIRFSVRTDGVQPRDGS